MPLIEDIDTTTAPVEFAGRTAPQGYEWVTVGGRQVLRHITYPGRQGPAANIPGDRQVWIIGGQTYLVWMAPVDTDGDGEFDETIPIAFRGRPEDFRNAGISVTSPARTISDEQYDSLGGLIVGNIVDLNNTETHPFTFFVEKMVENSVIYPFLLDPEIMALTAAAWLEGGTISEAALRGSEWWQSHSEGERAWIMLASSDPASADQYLTDNRIRVQNLLMAAGIGNATEPLVNLMADAFTRGEWSETYLTYQIDLVADPARQGPRDQLLTDFFAGNLDFVLDTTQSREDTVRDMVKRWLGPTFGNWSDRQISEWAGRLRTDPDAQQSLERLLSGQRLAMFPTYPDRTLTYEDISAPWRGLFQQVWGEIPDETDPFFGRIVNLNDSWEAQKLLLSEGMTRGVRSVTEAALRDLYRSVGSTQVVRAL